MSRHAYAGTWVPSEAWADEVKRQGVYARLVLELTDNGAEDTGEVRVLDEVDRLRWLEQHGDADDALTAAITDEPGDPDEWLYVVAYGLQR